METKTNQAIIVSLRNVRKHSNADRLQLATVHGSQVVVGLDAYEGQLGIYFDSNLQLSKEFAEANDLVRRKDADGKPAGGMFHENRKVKTQTFRGEKSDGFWTPINSLKSIGFLAIDELKEGMEFDELGGVPLCNKFIAKFEKTGGGGASGMKKARRSSIMFHEHYDTPQLGRNIHKIDEEGEIILTEKVHGTSQRYGHVQLGKEEPTSFFKKFLIGMSASILRYTGFKIQLTEWVYLNGTRRVVLDTETKRQSAFHDDNLREIAIKNMKGNLRKGETLYFEVVGYEPSGRPIMPTVDTTLLKDKAFTKLYANMEDGRGMVYKYGQGVGASMVYVYRITMTNEDGYVIDLPFRDVQIRCSEIGINTVPIIARFSNYRALQEAAVAYHIGSGGRPDIDDRDYENIILEYLEYLASQPSMLDSSHISEGLILRTDNGLTHAVYKHKSFNFKVLEGIVKDAGVVDMEELASLGEEV